MDNSAIRTAIETWISNATSISTDVMYWKNRPIGFRGKHVLLSMTSVAKDGIDSVNHVDNSVPVAGEEIIPVQQGNREFTVSITVVSYVSTDTEDSLIEANRIVDTTSLPENKALFKAASIGFQTVLSFVPVSEIMDNREKSITKIDVRFNADSRVEGTPTTYVEQWGVKSNTLDDINGNPAPDQIDELMP